MEKITSRNNKKILEAVELKKNNSDFFLIEGYHLIDLAYKSGLLKTIFSVKEESYKGVDFYLVTPEVLNKLSSTKTPEGIVGICTKPKSKEFSTNSVIFLDNVQDPGNVGTILRTALAFNFKDIILGEGCASLYNSKTILASQGAIFFLNIRKGNIQDINNLKKNNFKVLSTCLKDSVSFDSFKIPNEKLVIVFGNEGQGISKSILDISDYKVRIDMSNIDSLNVSIAAGIVLNKLKNFNL